MFSKHHMGLAHPLFFQYARPAPGQRSLPGKNDLKGREPLPKHISQYGDHNVFRGKMSYFYQIESQFSAIDPLVVLYLSRKYGVTAVPGCLWLRTE